MHRVLWIKFGGKTVHLIKLTGALFVVAAVLMVAQSAYNIFVTVQKATYAKAMAQAWSAYGGSLSENPIHVLFGWGMGAPYSFTGEDFLGVLLGPVAVFLFWLGIAVVGLMIYRSGQIILPIEEYEQRIQEHHRKLIEKAVRFQKKK